MAFAIASALKRITDRIPKEILVRAFSPQQYTTYYNVETIPSVITRLVIRGTVIPDCSRHGGTEMNIPIQSNWVELYDLPPRMVISIPPAARQMQEIISVLSVGYSNIGMSYQGYLPSGMAPVGMSQASNYARMAMDSASSIQPLVSTSITITPDGGGIVLLDAPTRVTMPMSASVILGHDSEMSDISSRVVPTFSKLCELATKIYIYNNVDISIDRAELEGGASIGRFADRVREYSEAMDEYDRILEEEWYAICMFNNPISKERFVSSLVGPGR